MLFPYFELLVILSGSNNSIDKCLGDLILYLSFVICCGDAKWLTSTNERFSRSQYTYKNWFSVCKNKISTNPVMCDVNHKLTDINIMICLIDHLAICAKFTGLNGAVNW